MRPLNVSTQTRCQDPPLLQFTAVPETQDEIHSYLQWVDTLSLLCQQQRKFVEIKLQSITSSSPALLAEREQRRQLEVENLRLRKEIADFKTVYFLFPEL